MANGTIKKEQELKNWKMYYKVMIKRDSIFAFWYEEFGSFDKKETDDIFNAISKAKNIKIYR